MAIATVQPWPTSPSTVRRGHARVVEEHLGEALSPSSCAMPRTRDALGVERHEEVREAVWRSDCGIGAEHAEAQSANAPRVRPGLLAVAARSRRRRASAVDADARRGRCPRCGSDQPWPRSPRRAPSAAGSAPSARACRTRRSSARAGRCRSGSRAAARRRGSTPPRRSATRSGSRRGRRTRCGHVMHGRSCPSASVRSHSRCCCEAGRAFERRRAASAGTCAASHARTSARNAFCAGV